MNIQTSDKTVKITGLPYGAAISIEPSTGVVRDYYPYRTEGDFHPDDARVTIKLGSFRDCYKAAIGEARRFVRANSPKY